MRNLNKNITSVKFIEKTNSLLLTTANGETFFLNANFALHELEIPYTKKNGETVTKEAILRSKQYSRKRYSLAIKNSKQQAAA